MDFKITYRKATLSVVLLHLSAIGACGQTYDEIFRQQKTQERYNLEQLSASSLYYASLKKGIELTASGLKTVQALKNKSFGLDSTFIHALGLPGSSVRLSASSCDVVQLEASTVRAAGSGKKEAAALPAGSTAERNYLLGIYDRVIEDCNAQSDQVSSLILSHNLKLSDADRLVRLTHLHQEARDTYLFVQQFRRKVTLLGHQRQAALTDNQSIHNLYAHP